MNKEEKKYLKGLKHLIGRGVGYIFPKTKEVRKLQIREIHLSLGEDLQFRPEKVRLEERVVGDFGKGWKYLDRGWVQYDQIFANRKKALIHRRENSENLLQKEIKEHLHRIELFEKKVKESQREVERERMFLAFAERRLKVLSEQEEKFSKKAEGKNG